MSATGMFLGHYMAWISAGFMGAAAAVIVKISIVDIAPGNVAFQALGYAGLVVAGWTTANANLYRSGLAAQGVVTTLSRKKATLIIGVIVLAASVFPFIYRNYLIFVTYASIALVPIGGILFASYWILRRLGLSTYWARYKGVNNVPALLTWGITLALAAASVAFGLMPVYFAFVPAFILGIILYVVLAKTMGAAESYPEGEAADELFDERVQARLAREAKKAHTDADTRDRSSLTKVLRVVWMVDLVVVFCFAVYLLLSSPDVAAYESHRNQFFWVAGVGTGMYFVSAYWELRRRKAHTKHVFAEVAA